MLPYVDGPIWLQIAGRRSAHIAFEPCDGNEDPKPCREVALDDDVARTWYLYDTISIFVFAVISESMAGE